jgi:hypothetical protein
MILFGVILLGVEIGPHLIKEIGTALVVAGLLTVFIDEYTKQEIVETIEKSQLDIRSTDARAFMSILFKRSIPDHVWNHCEDLFKAKFRREDYTAIYDLEESSIELEGITKKGVKIRQQLDFKIYNITDEDQEYTSRYRLEADGLKVGPDSLKKLEISKNDIVTKTYTPEEIKAMCTKEHEVDGGLDSAQEKKAIYLLWQGEPIIIHRGQSITVTQISEYYRQINDSDKFLSSAAANRLTVTINHPKEFNVLAFHVSPKRPVVQHRATSKHMSIEDVTPYQGIVFSWNKI